MIKLKRIILVLFAVLTGALMMPNVAKAASMITYTDKEAGVQFTLPENWTPKELSQERQFIDVKYVSTEDDLITLMFGATDLWDKLTAAQRVGQRRADFNDSVYPASEVAEMLGINADKATEREYNGIHYFLMEVTSSVNILGISVTVTMTHIFHIENGWIYWFQFSDKKSNDMINLAAEYVRTGKVRNPFSYVIVDEYQDISKARFNLLVELRKSRDFDLFCVGDDWQSIYRFAGSDINYILNFEKYWGKTTVSKIETTYRFTKSLIDISGTFIAQNPAQIKKKIQGKSSDTRFSLGEICGYTDKNAVDFMTAKLDDLPKNSMVYFIGRYSFDVKLLNESDLFTCQYNNVTGFIDVQYKRRNDLKMCFVTAHKSKGLQADYVFIINNKDSRMGFPSRMQNDPILDLLLEDNEAFPFAEERRLYYVALTRAKKKAYMLVQKGHESTFAKELHSRYENELMREQFECPICGGKLSRKTGPYGDFFGCENYKTTGCTYKRKIKTKQS